MARDLPHFHLRNLGKTKPFKPKGNPTSTRPSNVPNRAAHAQALLAAMDTLPDITANNLPGVYIEVSGRDNEALKTSSLDSSGLTLLKYESGSTPDQATIFATSDGIDKLRKKINLFETEDTPDREKDGEIIPGRPRNADLVQSIASIAEAGLRALWRSPENRFPTDDGHKIWEVWLEPLKVDEFVTNAVLLGAEVGGERIFFPEDVVVLVKATAITMAQAVRQIG